MQRKQAFRLKTSRSTSNMILFDKDGKIQKYNSAVDVLEEFAHLRLTVYMQRKRFMVAKLGCEKDILASKMRFITSIIDGKMKINNRKKADLVKDMKDVLGFKTMDDIKAANKYIADDDAGNAQDDEEEDAKVGPQKGFEYLLGMNLWSLTHEKVEELRKALAEKTAELDRLLKKTEPMLWEEDLNALDEVLKKTEAADAEDDAKALRLVEKSRRKAMDEKAAGKAKGGRAKAKKADSDSDDDKATP